MTVVLTATGCSTGGTKTNAPQQPSGTEAAETNVAAGADKTEAAEDTTSGEEGPMLVACTARSGASNNAMIPEFEKDTGTKVEVVVAGTGELLKRAQSERDNPLGDILWVTDQVILSSPKELLMKYVSPEDENTLDVLCNTIGHFTFAFTDPMVVIVNKDLKGDMKIDGLEDLLNPELKGKIVFGDPVSSNFAFQPLLVMLYDMSKDGDPLSNQVWDYVNQFIANLGDKMANGSSQVYKGVVEGKYMAGLTRGDPTANYVKEGVATEMVFPREGVIPPGESVQILRDCKHPENVRRFMDYTFSGEIQNAVSSNLAVRFLRKDIELAGYMTPQSEIELFGSYNEGWVAEYKTGIISLFSEYTETSMDQFFTRPSGKTHDTGITTPPKDCPLR